MALCMTGVITQRTEDLSETLKSGGLASFCLTTGSTRFFSYTGCGFRQASVRGRGEGRAGRECTLSFLSFLWKVVTGASKIYGQIFNVILFYLPAFLFISTSEDAMREENMEPEETEVDSPPSWYDFFFFSHRSSIVT